MSLRNPLLSRWAPNPTEFPQGASMLGSFSPRSLLVQRPASLNRTFSLARPVQSQGRRLPGQIKSRIDPIEPPRQKQFRRPFSSSRPKTESLSQRLRKLSREYGWSALGVYLLLSAVDFPFCFMAVRLLGAERIGHYEDVILQTVADAIRVVWQGKQEKSEEEEEKTKAIEEEKAEERAAKKADEASIWTQVALAYAIHKSLIFIRMPLTAAITPKVVKVLRAWGVDITRRRP